MGAMNQKMAVRKQTVVRIGNVIIAFALAVVIACPAMGQVKLQIDELDNYGSSDRTPDDGPDDLQRLHSDRRMLRQLEQLSEAARDERLAEVQDLMESLRNANPMLMVPQSNGTCLPLHRDLVLRQFRFPDAVRRVLEQGNIPAEAELRKTLLRGSPAELIIALQKTAGTQTSLKSHLLIALQHADRGQTLAAQYWLAPLLHAKCDPSLQAAALRLMAQMEDVNPVRDAARSGASGPVEDASLEDASKAETPADNSDAADDGSQAAISQANFPPVLTPVAGSFVRSESQKATQDNRVTDAASSEETPFAQHVHWMNSLPLSLRENQKSHDVVLASAMYGILPWSAWEPSFDAARIYVRTPEMISAYDRPTGRHLWTRTIRQERDAADPAEDLPAFDVPLDENAIQVAISSPEIQTLHRNEIVGRMTSDEERLFLVCQTGEANSILSRDGNLRLRAVINQGEVLSAGLRELIAVEKSSGRRLWTAGGAAVEEIFGNELALSWFAGPPAVSGRRLYCIVERRGSMQLACLSADTGEVQWKLPLIDPDVEIALDPARQLLAAQTTVQGGLIVTTTTTGWIFALDAMTHSILWARRLPANVSDTPRPRSFRNPAFFQTQLAPLGKAWRSESPFITSSSAVITCTECRDLLILNLLDGRIQRSTDVDGATMIVYRDNSQLITASPTEISAWTLPEMKQRWTSSRGTREAVAVGSGSRIADRLLVPMSDGSLDVYAISDGTRLKTLRNVRPAGSSGGLFSDGEDIISYGPSYLSLLSSAPASGHDDSDPLKLARFLVETNRLKEAETALSQVQVHALNADQVRRLRFRISVGLIAEQQQPGSDDLQRMSSLASTPEELALSHFLRIDRLLQLSPETADTVLTHALTENESVQQVEIPEAGYFAASLESAVAENPLQISSLVTGTRSLRRPFRAWILQRLRILLETADEQRRSELLLVCRQLSDEDVLEMNSRFLNQEYLRRADQHISSGPLQEVTLQLLMATAETLSADASVTDEQRAQAASRILAVLSAAESHAKSLPDSDVVYQALLQRMIMVVRNELLDLLRQPLAPELIPSDLRVELTSRWEQEGDEPMTMVPVSTVGQMSFRTPNVMPIEIASEDDAFLSAFRWSLRRTPGALLAQPLVDSVVSPWTLKTGASDVATMQSEEELHRFGSIVILQNLTGLAAFSLTDQRWLWSRRMPSGLSRRIFSIMNRPFREFTTSSSPQMITGYARRIGGGSRRWICLASEGTLEVVDLYTGKRVWAMNGLKSTSTVVACNSVICVSGIAADPLTLSPLDGKAIECPNQDALAGQLSRTLCGSGDELIVWNSGVGDLAPRIEWVDPVSGKSGRIVELPQMEYAQFLNRDTLVAVTDAQTFHVVHLKTGERRTMSYAESGDSNECDLVPQRIAVASDAVNYYLFERSEDDTPITQGSMYGLRARLLHRELRAVSRKTGELAWIRPVEGTLLACFEGTESVLVFVHVVQKSGGRNLNIPGLPGLQMQSGQRHLIDGLSRTTGRPMLNYAVVAQIPVPSLRLTKTSAGDLDLEVFGNRVRFAPQHSVTSP